MGRPQSLPSFCPGCGLLRKPSWERRVPGRGSASRSIHVAVSKSQSPSCGSPQGSPHGAAGFPKMGHRRESTQDGSHSLPRPKIRSGIPLFLLGVTKSSPHSEREADKGHEHQMAEIPGTILESACHTLSFPTCK